MKKYALLLPLAALLVACPQPTPQTNPLTQQDAKSLKAIVPLAMNGLANAVRGGGSSAAGSAATFGLRPQNTTGNCGPSTKPVDVDNDKIPANFAYTYNCTVTIGAGFKFIAKGSLSSKDSDDNNDNSGYSANGNIRYDFIFTNTDTNQSSSFSFVLQWTANAVLLANGGYSISTDQQIVFQPDSDKSQFGYQLSVTYTPDNDGNAQKFDAGTLNLTGSANFRDAAGRFSVFNLSASNLHFGNACPRAIDSGSLRVEDLSNIGSSKTNVLLLTATGCDIWNATYNGSVIF
jgi:hypothetical protein